MKINTPYFKTCIVLIVVLFSTNLVWSQVGIGTTNPQEQLHIAGNSSTIRIDGLNSTNATENNGTDLAPLAVDTNGDIVIGGSTFLSKLQINQTSADSFLVSPAFISSNTGAAQTATIHTQAITLTQTTLVEVVFWTDVRIRTAALGTIDDGRPRLYGAGVVYDGTGEDVANTAQVYTNTQSTGAVVTSGPVLTANGYIELGPGNHTFRVIIYGLGGPTQGYDIEYGALGFTKFQIILHN